MFTILELKCNIYSKNKLFYKQLKPVNRVDCNRVVIFTIVVLNLATNLKPETTQHVKNPYLYSFV